MVFLTNITNMKEKKGENVKQDIPEINTSFRVNRIYICLNPQEANS